MKAQSLINWTTLGLGVCLLLAACGKSATEKMEPMPVKDTVFAPAVNQLDKARDTQQVLDNANQNTDAALKQAE